MSYDHWVNDPRYHTVPLPFSLIQAAIECQAAGLTLGDLHDAANSGSRPLLRTWLMGQAAVPNTTRAEVSDWLDRRAEARIAERTQWTIEHSSQADLDIARLIA